MQRPLRFKWYLVVPGMLLAVCSVVFALGQLLGSPPVNPWPGPTITLPFGYKYGNPVISIVGTIVYIMTFAIGRWLLYIGGPETPATVSNDGFFDGAGSGD